MDAIVIIAGSGKVGLKLWEEEHDMMPVWVCGQAGGGRGGFFIMSMSSAVNMSEHEIDDQ